MSDLAIQYQKIQNQIQAIQDECGRSAPTLIAVSKSQSFESILELYELGQRDFGENYAQELIEKDEKLKARGILDLRWHFIGHLQTNKVKSILPRVYSIHTVSSLKLAQEIVRRVSLIQPPLEKLPIFVEVNLHRESSKSGVTPEEVISFVENHSQYPQLNILGLMCVPDPDQDTTEAFRSLAKLELQCRPFTQGQLSMGMSSDFQVALRCGSTHIRLGTILFGRRNY